MLDEKALFELLKEWYIPDLVMSRNQFSSWDCYSPITKMRIELKCRRKHYDELLIERFKYNKMMDKVAPHGDTPYYICATPNGVWSFNLHKVEELEWFIKRMPRTTDFSRREYVEKEVGVIHIDLGTNLFVFNKYDKKSI